MRSPCFAGPLPRVLGHRGAAGLAPENTLPSFALAAGLGAEVFELDVHASRDGVVVVIHDPTLERTTDGQGPVNDLSWDQLQRLDAGFRFSRDGSDFPYRGQGVRLCSFESLLQAFPHMAYNVEIKQAEPCIVDAVVDIVRRAGAERRVMLAAEHDSIMQVIRPAAGDIATSFSAAEVAAFVQRLRDDDFVGYAPAGRALQIPPRFGPVELATRESVAAAHRLGLEVHVWTVNQRDEMEELLDLGVDGLISDLPGLARTVIDARRARS